MRSGAHRASGEVLEGRLAALVLPFQAADLPSDDHSAPESTINLCKEAGESGMFRITMPCPRASSTAEAVTAATGITPASPAPLMPRGFSGERDSRWSISMDGSSVA